MRTTAAVALLLFATVAVTACSDDDDASPSASPTVGVSAKASFAGFPTPTDPSAPLPTPEPATALPTPVPVVTSDNGLPYYEDSTGLSFNYPAGWHLSSGFQETRPGESPRPSAETSYTVVVGSGDPAVVPQDGIPPYGKADIYIELANPGFDPATELARLMTSTSEQTAIENVVIGGEPAIRQSARSSEGLYVAIAIVIHENRRFTIVSLNNDAVGVEEVLDTIADSFRCE